MDRKLLKRNIKSNEDSEEKQRQLCRILDTIICLTGKAQEIAKGSDESEKNEKTIILSCPDTL